MSSAKNKSLLLIEDDKSISESFTEILREYGYEVRAAMNGEEALEYLSSVKDLPAMILLDIMMPVMDGYEFRERQLKLPRLAQIPTVVLSADGHIQEKSQRLSVAHFLKKPVDLEQLLGIVEKFCAA